MIMYNFPTFTAKKLNPNISNSAKTLEESEASQLPVTIKHSRCVSLFCSLPFNKTCQSRTKTELLSQKRLLELLSINKTGLM